MLNFCPNCGGKLSSEDVFCPYCGYKLPQASESTETVAHQNEAAQTQQPNANVPGISFDAYNGSGNPGLIQSWRFWWQTAFKPKQCMGRADYWWGILMIALISLILCVLSILLAIVLPDSAADDIFPVTPLCIIYLVVVMIFATVQRLHDAGHSGYNWLWCLTGIGAIYVLVLTTQPTDRSYTEFPRNYYKAK